MQGWGSQYSLGRPGEPSEVAPTYVFLASREASLYCMWIWNFPRSDAAVANYVKFGRWTSHTPPSPGRLNDFNCCVREQMKTLYPIIGFVRSIDIYLHSPIEIW